MQQRHAYRSFIVTALAIWMMTPAVAQERGPLWGVTQMACSGKTTPLLKFLSSFQMQGEARWTRVEGIPVRYLVVPDAQCLAVYKEPAILIIGNKVDEHHANYYLTSPRGELIRGTRVYGVPDGTTEYTMVDAADPILRAEFEAQKVYWMTKQGLPTR